MDESWHFEIHFLENKANLRDLIAATSLVILLGLCDLEIGPMALKYNRDLLPCPLQLCVSFHSHQCIWLSRNAQIGSKLAFCCLPWPRNWIDDIEKHLSYASSSFMHHFLVISEFKFELQSGNAQIRSILAIFCLLWPWNFTNDLEKQ